jgi:hypothetical protein
MIFEIGSGTIVRQSGILATNEGLRSFQPANLQFGQTHRRKDMSADEQLGFALFCVVTLVVAAIIFLGA